MMIELKEIPEPKNTAYNMTLKPSYINILAKFMMNGAEEDDPERYRLDFLRGLYKKVYNENRIQAGFANAAKMANIRVINAILMGEHEQIDLI